MSVPAAPRGLVQCWPPVSAYLPSTHSVAGGVQRAGATETDREVPEKLTEGEKEAQLVLGLWDPKAGACTVSAELEDRPVGINQPRKRLSVQQRHHTRDSTSFQVLARCFCQKPGCLGGSPAPAGLRNQSQGSHIRVLSEQPWPYHPSLTAALLPCGMHQMKTQGDKEKVACARSTRGLAPGAMGPG